MEVEIDDYEKQTDLLEKFLAKGDRVAFRKMLNMNLTNANEKAEKEREKFERKKKFFSSMKNRHHSHFHENCNDYFSDRFNSKNNNLYDPFPSDINKYKIDFHNFLQDPEYKDKCMKGNYRWANMKFQMIKSNLAKRKGINVNDFQMAKIPTRKTNNMEMNGKIIMSNGNLNNINPPIAVRSKSNEAFRSFKSCTMPRKNNGINVGVNAGGGIINIRGGINNNFGNSMSIKRQNTQQQVQDIICELNGQ